MLLPMLRDVGRERHGNILRSIAELVEQGKLKPLLDKNNFSLAQVPDAHRHLESGNAIGKVVIDIE
ncbi:zinc-binding dehydrogenase family protein [Collimonas arenae]|uniref:Zinc-binding dehydrogenase family protein n=2 Tax=Collimonas arenae TaxID=279058 RepID=A0A127QEG4_9BURK|nr:zinc-binding dehydrogenase family protein [Collimonas arenae]AMP08215.1 zinc-binding dehydrogenase family protein [Collimonas arenae]